MIRHGKTVTIRNECGLCPETNKPWSLIAERQNDLYHVKVFPPTSDPKDSYSLCVLHAKEAHDYIDYMLSKWTRT